MNEFINKLVIAISTYTVIAITLNEIDTVHVVRCDVVLDEDGDFRFVIEEKFHCVDICTSIFLTVNHIKANF